jgi:hypothetical protein
MQSNEELRLDVQLVTSLEAAIDNWLSARKCKTPRHL